MNQQAHEQIVRENHEQFVQWANRNVAGTKKPADYDEINAEIDRVAAEIRAARESMQKKE